MKDMFDKLKQLKQINDLKKAMEEEVVEIEKEGTKVAVNGKFEIVSIVLNPSHDAEKNAKLVKDAFNDAMKQLQTKLASKLGSMGFGM